MQDQSKDLNCPICLHPWNDPTVLDNCNHVFCFECIIEWTRLKPECPLCKRSLQEIKHRLWLGGEKIPSWSSEGQKENIVELRSEFEMLSIAKKSAHAPEFERQAVINVVKHMLSDLGILRNISIASFASDSIYKRAISDIEKEMDEYRRLLNAFSKGMPRSDLFREPAFRRVVYKKNLSPSSICQPMFNIALNTDYIKNNKDSVKSHMIPYVVREVSALTRKDSVDIDLYMEKFLEYFTGKMKRQQIVTFLNRQGIENPHQFLNNLLHFASSGQTLKVYDQNSEYHERRSNFVGDLFPEDDDVLVLNSSNLSHFAGDHITEDDDDVLVLNNSNLDVEVIGVRNGRSQQLH